MKTTITIVFLFFSVSLISSCSIKEDTSSETLDSTETLTEWKCNTHNEKTLWTGPKGGCYYKNSNGNKTYVDRSECNC